MSKGVHVAHNKLEASPQDQRGQGGHGAIPLSAGMLLVTLGVVYGDIGTSPMYTMKSIVANNGGIGTVSEDMILGALSLVIWTMTLVTTVKYVVIAMKADNHNEGGIFALFSLVRKVAPWLILPAMIGGAALLADGILTPRGHGHHSHRGPAYHRVGPRAAGRRPDQRHHHHHHHYLRPICHAARRYLVDR